MRTGKGKREREKTSKEQTGAKNKQEQRIKRTEKTLEQKDLRIEKTLE